MPRDRTQQSAQDGLAHLLIGLASSISRVIELLRSFNRGRSFWRCDHRWLSLRLLQQRSAVIDPCNLPPRGKQDRTQTRSAKEPRCLTTANPSRISPMWYFSCARRWLNGCSPLRRPAVCACSTHPPITTSLIAADRLASNCASERFARRACAMAIGGFTSSYGVRVGATVRTRRGASIAS